MAISDAIGLFFTVGHPYVYMARLPSCMLTRPGGILTIGFLTMDKTKMPVILIFVLPVLAQLYFGYFLYLNGGVIGIGTT